MVEDRDLFFMHQALRLAERGRGCTTPNPMVGALVVDADGVIVGRGAHAVAGGPHAEVLALQDAGGRARGATLYCTLEPCNHTGRTGPCAPLIVDAGIARAVLATSDPNPLAAGGGALLAARGIEVTTGILAVEAQRLNAGYFSRIVRGRPFVTMKVALSLDGRIASRPGARTALTGSAANRSIHRDRAEVDAIAVGSETLIVDDPSLTARVAFRVRPLVRVVYDRRLRIPASARLLSTLHAGPVIIVTTHGHLARAERQADSLRAAGAEILAVDDRRGLRGSLEMLAGRGIGSMLVEGGAALHQAFWDAGLVDRVQMYVSSHVIGEGGVEWLPEPVIGSPRVTARNARPVGTDVLLEAYVHGID